MCLERLLNRRSCFPPREFGNPRFNRRRDVLQQFSLGKTSIALKWERRIAYVLLSCGFVTGSGATAQAQTIITIDAPGAGTNGSNSQGTYATGINASGVITGYFYDSSFGSTLYGGCH